MTLFEPFEAVTLMNGGFFFCYTDKAGHKKLDGNFVCLVGSVFFFCQFNNLTL